MWTGGGYRLEDRGTSESRYVLVVVTTGEIVQSYSSGLYTHNDVVMMAKAYAEQYPITEMPVVSQVYEIIEVYKGWQIGRLTVTIGFYEYKAENGIVSSPWFDTLDQVRGWVDLQTTGGTWNPDDFSPDLQQWVGTLLPADRERENKLVALGPAPPGLAGKVEGLILLVLVSRLSKTPEGLKILKDWGTSYLNNIGKIITGISTSSAANVYNCLINQYVAVRIYQRMGLMSAHDAVQTAAWLDHAMGEMIKAGYFKESIGGLTTLVNATSETGLGGERSVGLASLAKLFSGGP